MIGSLQKQLSPLIALVQTIKGLGGLTGNIPAQPTQFGVGASASVGAGIFRPRGIGGGGGGGGRGGGGGGSSIDAGVTLLQQLQKEFFRLTEHTRLEEIQEQLLEKQFAKTSDQIKKRIMITAIEIDIQKKTLAITRERFASEESYARFAEQEFIKSLTRVRQWSKTVRERMVTDRPPWIDLGGGSTVGGEPGTTTRPRVATVELQVLREQMEIARQRARELASDLTSTIDNALRAGFESGMKAGLIEFSRGLLAMIESALLTALQNKLASLFEGLFSGGGGGGGLLSAGIGILTGAISGGGGGGATWGTIGSTIGFPGMKSSGGMKAAGGTTINFNLAPNTDATSFLSRKTQSEIRRELSKTVKSGLLYES